MVRPLDEIVDDLKSLSEAKLEKAANYIHRLKGISMTEKQAALERTFGCMTEEEAKVMEDAVKECRKIDPNEW